MITRLYMAVTADKYELPIAVADTAKELSQMIGRSMDVIYTGINRSKRRAEPEKCNPAHHGSMRYYRIEFDTEDQMEVTHYE